MRDKDLSKNWPNDGRWPQNEQEFKEYLKSDKLIAYLEERGIELRYDEKTDHVTIKKLDSK